MTHTTSDVLLTQLSEFVADRVGLHFPRDRWGDLERGIGSAARELGYRDAASCIPWLVSSSLTKTELDVLASHLTVGETYFFREKRSFEILEQQILPELIRSRRETEPHLRIWCAGCCTGEEPYSVAILLDRLIPDIADWRITILGTDINPRFLQKATDGEYGLWSFRDTPGWVRGTYFAKRPEGGYEISREIKEMVTFSYLNLAEDTYPSLLNSTNGMDLILCRNVLMYFSPGRAQGLIRNLYRSLVEGGWLMVSAVETSQIFSSQFVTVNFPGATLYKKDSRKSQVVQDHPPILASLCAPGGEMQQWSQPVADAVAEPETTPPGELSEPLGQEVQGTEIPELRPNSQAAALALYEQGRYVEAEGILAGLLSDDRGNSKALALLARACANQGKLTEALEWCEKAIGSDRLNPVGYYLFAAILQEHGRAQEAVGWLKRALYLDQDFVPAHVALGNLALRQGQLKASGRHFENALSLLSRYGQEEVLPESDGMTAGRLGEIIRATTSREAGVRSQKQEARSKNEEQEPGARSRKQE